MPGVGRANCLLGIRGGAGITGRDVDGGATARVVSELDRTRHKLFMVQIKEPSAYSGESHAQVISSIFIHNHGFNHKKCRQKRG